MISIIYRKRPVVLIGPPNIGRHELRQVTHDAMMSILIMAKVISEHCSC